MNKIVLLCVETNKKARTDYMYISETLQRFYKDTRKITYRPIFLESKSKYKNKGKIKEINDMKKGCNRQVDVIYFIDLDDYDINPDTKKLNENIENFCNENNYYFVFFCKNIEDVYLNMCIDDSKKVQESEKFKRQKLINQVEEENLSKNSYNRHCSNILTILDNFWTRKD